MVVAFATSVASPARLFARLLPLSNALLCSQVINAAAFPLSSRLPQRGLSLRAANLPGRVSHLRGGCSLAMSSDSILHDGLYTAKQAVTWEKDGQTYEIGGWAEHKLPPGTKDDSQDPEEQDTDWVDGLDLEGAIAFDPPMPDGTPKHRPRTLVMYGSLRPESFSRKLAFECARILERMGCDVRVYHAQGLPLRDPAIESHPKVQELRQLSLWSEGHVWVSPEMHGEVTGTFKTQIDWLPLNSGSVRPTQGRTVMIAQVSGGSQSFNTVNTLRKLARWMRMPCVTNQSSVPKAWKEFTEGGRMKDSELRERVVDVCEEFYKFTLLMRPYAEFMVDRYSERKEKAEKGRLQTQAEKETAKDTLLKEVKKSMT